MDENARAERPKINCWEFMGCGREPGGRQVAEMGVCPATLESRLDGSLGGVNGGRCCWVVAGTFCNGAPQGTFAKRFATCKQCEFFTKVHLEEFPFSWQAGLLLSYLSGAEAEDRDRYDRVLHHMVDPAIIRYVLNDPSVLEKAETKHVTAFFSDLTGFSDLAGKLDAATLGSFVNEYLSAMTDILKAEGGTLDKYIGDGMVGIFGAPTPLANDAVAAARAALRMQHRLAELRTEWRERGVFGPKAWSLQMRIGLNSGVAKVGFMGTSDFASYTMCGATVNLAKWLEQACKVYAVPILVGQATRDLIASEMVMRRIDTVQPKGNVSTETVFELLGPTGSTSPQVLRAAEIYETALDLYNRNRWAAAAKLLERAARQEKMADPASERLLRRCKRLDAARRDEHSHVGRVNRRRLVLVDDLVQWFGATVTSLGLTPPSRRQRRPRSERQ